MRSILSTGLIVLLSAGMVCAQKRTTILGDAWTGEVTSASDATREITLRHPDKTKSETFVGVLEEGYKVKMRDGGARELKVSELTPGTRIRVFYKTGGQNVGGRKVKIRSIYRIDFLGRDEYTRLREALNLEPSIPVTVAGSGRLPAASPLKVYLAVEQPHVKEGFVEWVSRWNKEQAAKYGAIELVPEPSRSDISLVVYWGADETVMLLPAMIHDRGAGRARDFFYATAHVVSREGEGLKILWQKSLLLSREKMDNSAAQIEKEFERAMKARLKK